MNLILCHTTADFDTLGAAVGLSRLQPGARVVLAGDAHPTVRDFLALYRDEYPLLERRSVNPEQIRSLTVVDTQKRDRLGQVAQWLDQPQVEIAVYDHHLGVEQDIAATKIRVEAVGAATTLVVEELQAHHINLSAAEATVMALGIHVDTGSLTFDYTTLRDAIALTWLMAQGANLPVIAEYKDPGLSDPLQELLTLALEQLRSDTAQGYSIASVLLPTESHTPGLSHLAAHLMALTDSDSLLLGSCYPAREAGIERLTVIGRSRIEGVDLNALLKPLGGGGHPRAAAVTLRTPDAPASLEQLLTQLKQQIPRPPAAQMLMSTPVRTIRPETTIDQAQRILLRYGHSGLPVVDGAGQLMGMISRRDLDIALHHGFSHAPVKGYMTSPVKTIHPHTLLPEIESLMVTYDIGRLPVLAEVGIAADKDRLVGIVTRTDVLRQLHQLQLPTQKTELSLIRTSVKQKLQHCLSHQQWQLLTTAAEVAEQRNWQLYLVGGAVRDLLLAADRAWRIHEFDLVVDGIHDAPAAGAGVELARSLQQSYPEAQLQIHSNFQTAALRWPETSALGAFEVDIATARTEFYPYPAA
ncbi:MAG TPA: CBS domain-containing protein, partial [Candidatus Caenarcaniphilales bacterium]